MMEKWLLYVNGASLGLRYNLKRRQISIGGNKKFRASMEEAIKKIFLILYPITPVLVQGNKIRYDFKIKKWFDVSRAIEKLTEEGFTVVPTTKLGRIMR